jgi:hypothetical protein
MRCWCGWRQRPPVPRRVAEKQPHQGQHRCRRRELTQKAILVRRDASVCIGMSRAITSRGPLGRGMRFRFESSRAAITRRHPSRRLMHSPSRLLLGRVFLAPSSHPRSTCATRSQSPNLERPAAAVRAIASILPPPRVARSHWRRRDRRDGFRHSHSEATQPCRTRSARDGRYLPAARSARSRVWRGGIDDLDAESGEPSDNRDACIFREVRRPRQQSLVVAAAVPCLS